jgi:2-amino-4-hydroxy-6-hydroxymethyldihydropteridine diphosphokinase
MPSKKNSPILEAEACPGETSAPSPGNVPPTRTGIALGSNRGDRLANLRRGRNAIAAFGTGPLLVSRVYETDPVDCEPDSPSFLNAVLEIGFDGNPLDLLADLQRIESDAGRPILRPLNAPRTLDLDLLYCGDRTLSTERLTLPHPRLHERRFVLAPLHDIRPDLILPNQTVPVAALLAALTPEPRARVYADLL